MASSEQNTKSKGIFQVTKRSIGEFSSDDMLTYAAALAYQIFFSLFRYHFHTWFVGVAQPPERLRLAHPAGGIP